jgi:hypothetical protein
MNSGLYIHMWRHGFWLALFQSSLGLGVCRLHLWVYNPPLNSVGTYLLNISNQACLGNKQCNTMQISLCFQPCLSHFWLDSYPNYISVTMQADEAKAILTNTKSKWACPGLSSAYSTRLSLLYYELNKFIIRWWDKGFLIRHYMVSYCYRVLMISGNTNFRVWLLLVLSQGLIYVLFCAKFLIWND